jgi:hypothetical protein
MALEPSISSSQIYGSFVGETDASVPARTLIDTIIKPTAAAMKKMKVRITNCLLFIVNFDLPQRIPALAIADARCCQLLHRHRRPQIFISGKHFAQAAGNWKSKASFLKLCRFNLKQPDTF